MALRSRIKAEHHLIFVLFILLIVTLISHVASAKTFVYKNGLTINAVDYKTAAKLCYNKITKGIYINEEFNLEAVDICVNPK